MLRLDNNKYIQIIYNKSRELIDCIENGYNLDNQ